MTQQNIRVVVTGATGFLGRHLMPLLKKQYCAGQVTGLSSKDYDLMVSDQVRRMFEECRPDILIHLAAYSGGIEANRTFPADFYYRNSLLTTLAFHWASHFRIAKLIYTMGGCSYPSKASSPIGENQMWEGYPQHESAGYSMAKKMGIVASTAYRRQYGLNSTILIPGNMYGEYDNYRLRDAHVIPALIRKMYEAKRNKTEKVVMWGSGKPTRDFVYAGDVASIIPWFIEHFDETGPVNISTGVSTSIEDLVETVKDIVGFDGEIVWDTAKPDGQIIKIFDPARLHSLGLSCATPLRDGLQRTISWFQTNYESGNDEIRL